VLPHAAQLPLFPKFMQVCQSSLLQHFVRHL
jgi:hypothetical protein